MMPAPAENVTQLCHAGSSCVTREQAYSLRSLSGSWLLTITTIVTPGQFSEVQVVVISALALATAVPMPKVPVVIVVSAPSSTRTYTNSPLSISTELVLRTIFTAL